MMLSLFSSFDLNLNNFAISPIIIYAISPMFVSLNYYWLTPSHRQISLFQMTMVSKSISSATSGKFIKNFLFSIIFIIYLIMTLNISGALPIFPTLTSHLSLTMSLSFPVWLAMVMTITLTNPNSLHASFIPESSPLALSWFLAIVEVISSLIRPLTLAFRLAANISAGHVILAMLTSASLMSLSLYMSVFSLFSSILPSIGYTMFEFAICGVQAYVFSLLTSMYSNDYVKSFS